MNIPSPRWIVAQEGSRQTYAVPLSFHRLGMLHRFYADTWCRWGRSWLRRGSKGLRAFATHFNPEIPPERVVSFNSSTVIPRTLFYYRKPRLTQSEIGEEYCRFGEKFARLVRDHLRKCALSAGEDRFFGFNSNCLETIAYLREQGIFTVVDQVDPARVEEDLCVEESERWPGWEKAPGRMPQSYWDRVKSEWDLADRVLVNSEWSADALGQQGVPRKKIMVIPLAIDLSRHHEMVPVDPTGDLKVLWLGSIILRKGIQYLVEAARLVEKERIEFLLVGTIGVSEQAIRSFPSNVKIRGSVTRDQLSAIYCQAQVFVLPTLSDGFAITQLEAMSHGLPVVTTPNCGRVVEDGVNGLVVPARNSQALADALVRLNADRELLRAMSCSALNTALRYDLPSNAMLINKTVENSRQKSANAGTPNKG